MKTTKNKSTYRIPKFDSIVTVIAYRNKQGHMLQHRDIDFGLPTLTHGFPTSFSTNKKDKIEFYPIPDKSYKIVVQYMPQVKEF